MSQYPDGSQFYPKTLEKFVEGDLPIGHPLDGKSFAISVITGGCYAEGRPYPDFYHATSAWGDQSDSYIRLVGIKKLDKESIHQAIYSVPLQDYEVEIDFSVTLYKDAEGKEVWKRFTNGKMKLLMTHFKE